MGDVSALKVAIELVHVPSRARLIRASPLPDGMGELIGVAADNEALLTESADLLGRPREILRGAATFFVEQILLAPDANSYRVLGARSDAPAGELRRNMALLLKVLHPDLSQNKERAVFAGRVTRAWEDVKTKERRQAYDQALAAQRLPGGVTPRGQRSSRIGRNTKASSDRSAAAVLTLARREQDQKRSGSVGVLRKLMALFSKS